MAKISGGSDLQKALNNIASKLKKGGTLQVGFMDKSTDKYGMSNAAKAFFNEYGTPNADHPIPPRPFFRDMIAGKSGRWPRGIATQLVATNYDIQRTLEITGEVIEGQLKDSINNGAFAPLAQSTIDAKGFDKALIDTSAMVNSVTHKVKT